MTHEPECQLITWGVPVPTCTCTALRAAYQRGREDAANDVKGLGSLLRWVSETGWLPGRFESVDAVAAARGGRDEDTSGWYCGNVGCPVVGEHEHSGGVEAARGDGEQA